ncbi:MAG: hypothetical protein VWZ99_04475 [Aquiluna sp.]|jgi:hypothetical protein
MRNNSLAMLGTIAAIGILAWWIGFFDPTTCTPDVQVEGWTSCEQIAAERNIALGVLIAIVITALVVTLIRFIRSRRG